jgi:hypothetical protein
VVIALSCTCAWPGAARGALFGYKKFNRKHRAGVDPDQATDGGPRTALDCARGEPARVRKV